MRGLGLPVRRLLLVVRLRGRRFRRMLEAGRGAATCERLVVELPHYQVASHVKRLFPIIHWNETMPQEIWSLGHKPHTQTNKYTLISVQTPPPILKTSPLKRGFYIKTDFYKKFNMNYFVVNYSVKIFFRTILTLSRGIHIYFVQFSPTTQLVFFIALTSNFTHR